MRASLCFLLAVICVVAASWQPLRIHLEYDSHVEALDASTKQAVKDETRKAADYWQKTLKVRRADGPLRVRPPCGKHWKDRCESSCSTKCDVIDIPAQHLLPCVTYPASNGNVDTDDAKHSINGVLGFTQAKYDAALATTPGVDADLIFYVTVMDGTRDASLNRGSCAAKTLAANALSCAREKKWGRPVAGRIVVCKEALGNKDFADILRHEMLHIMIFTEEHYKYFWKDGNTPYTKRNADNELSTNPEDQTPITKEVTYGDWWTRNGRISHKVTVINTPRVVKEARAHFNCHKLEGAEIENQGGPGSKGSHWEKRLFRYDLIQAQGTAVQIRVSRMTLAFLEDSGWYQADYSNAQEIPWGKNLGCDFAMKSCGEWIKNRRKKGFNPTPFCDRTATSQGLACTPRRNSLGVCGLKNHAGNPPPPEFQYFPKIPDVPDSDTHLYGGDHKYADYCPYVREISPRNMCNDKTALDNQKIQNTQFTPYLQEFGADSRCIDFGAWTSGNQLFNFYSNSGPPRRGGCYKTECSGGKLNVFVDGKRHTCSSEGQLFTVIKEINGVWIEGSLICPAYGEVCDSSSTSHDSSGSTGVTAFLGFIVLIALFFGLLLGLVSSPIMY